MSEPTPRRADLDRPIARVLMAGTYLSMVLVTIGVALMVRAGISPLDPAPTLDPAGVVDSLAALGPEGFLWLGLVAVILTPTLRVVTSLVGYLLDGERTMALVAVGILSIVVASVALALGLEG